MCRVNRTSHSPGYPLPEVPRLSSVMGMGPPLRAVATGGRFTCLPVDGPPCCHLPVHFGREATAGDGVPGDPGDTGRLSGARYPRWPGPQTRVPARVLSGATGHFRRDRGRRDQSQWHRHRPLTSTERSHGRGHGARGRCGARLRRGQGQGFLQGLGWRLDADFVTVPDVRVVQLTPPGRAHRRAVRRGSPPGRCPARAVGAARQSRLARPGPGGGTVICRRHQP
jgi:hypothetical protein